MGSVTAFAALLLVWQPDTAQAAVGSHTYTVTATLDGRTVKDVNNHAYPNKYPSGSSVTITCQDSGGMAYGSTVWDRTTDHLWVPDYYVRTGHSSYTDELPRCINNEAPTGSQIGHPFPARATLDGRTAKDVNNHAYPNKYPVGSTIWVQCQDTGPSAYGSNIWDWTSDRLWVPDHYVGTGTTGFFGKDVPTCDGGEPTGETTVGAHGYPARATLDGRTAKSLSNHAFPNRYPNGSTVLVTCQSTGPRAYGSTVWDLTSDGLWVTDYYIGTGSVGFSPDLPRCRSSTRFTVSATLDGRTTKNISNHAYPDRYASGSTVSVTCQAYGGATYGGFSLWDFTVDDLWVVDYYVETGVDGLFPGIPRCDTTPPAGSSNPPPPDGGPTPPSTQPEKVAAAIAAARAEITNHPNYAWGGGHGAVPGATRGYCDDDNGYLNGECVADDRIGFDCSGLMRWSYYQATAYDWGSVGTSSLYDNRPSIFNATIWNVNDLRAGDLILSDPGNLGHVHHTLIVSAVNGSVITVIEAPRTSIPLRETTFDEPSFLKAYRLA